VALGERGVMEVECRRETHLSQRAVGRRHFGQISGAGQIACRGNQPHPLPQLAQTLVQCRFVHARRVGQEVLHLVAGVSPVNIVDELPAQVRLRLKQAAAKTGTSDEAINSGMGHGLTCLLGSLRSMPKLAFAGEGETRRGLRACRDSLQAHGYPHVGSLHDLYGQKSTAKGFL